MPGRALNLAKFGIIAVAVVSLLAILWGTGSVKIYYVRNQASTSRNNEALAQDSDEFPLTDGLLSEISVPNHVPRNIASRSPISEASTPHPQPIANGIPLRIMFLGASITLGDPLQSAYRQQLRDWLVSLGNEVNCVGTNRFGEFKDNDVQAFAATPVKLLHEAALDAVPAMEPNLIIVNAGSSDCFQEEKWGSAHGYHYTRALVDFLFAASPRATVILSTLVMSTDERFERCIKSFNAQIRQVVRDLEREGKPILLSEQHYDQGLPDRVTARFLKDDRMHPTFEGWVMMGEIYKRDIRDADAKGWIIAPTDNGITFDGDAERDLEDAGETRRVGEERTVLYDTRHSRRNHT
ncbi:hypothetical protein GGS21DRAFT_518604 [Xylaria nigripes]|nr:hypothetical protein GGS21DRAFT_518604 [Xylaria nigripes]